MERLDSAPEKLDIPRRSTCNVTPLERADEGPEHHDAEPVGAGGRSKHLAPFRESLKAHPPIPMGTPDPYAPPKPGK